MATAINVSALTLAAKEAQAFSEFIAERMYSQPALNQICTIMQGIQMKQQIVFAGLMGNTGIKDSGCTRVTSSPASVLTQKYLEPIKVSNTIVHCQNDVDALFKAYANKVQKYTDLYDITGTDEEKFLAIMLAENATATAQKLAWLADKDVVQAAAAVSGVNGAARVKYYDPIYGLWYRIFAGVTATTISKYAITENSGATIAAQKTLAADRTIEIFEEMWATADPRLKADPNKQLLVSNWLFENYRQSLQTKGGAFDISLITDGLPQLKWNGIPVINMESVWDLYGQADWLANTTDNTYYLPNRAILTVPENLIIGTLTEGDISEVEAFYDKITRQFYMAYGFTMDTQVAEHYMIEVAY